MGAGPVPDPLLVICTAGSFPGRSVAPARVVSANFIVVARLIARRLRPALRAMILPGWLRNGYLRLIDPVAGWLVKAGVSPNSITTVGTLCTVGAGGLYASGSIRAGGWFMGLTALFDVLDGEVARRTGRSTLFGAFYDSTLDRVADAAVLGGLLIFFSADRQFGSTWMVAVTLVALAGALLTSYTRAKADALGIDAKTGVLQRPERVTLLSAPMAFFGLMLDGWVLRSVVIFLAIAACVTVVQRVVVVARETRGVAHPAGPSVMPPRVRDPAPADRSSPAGPAESQPTRQAVGT